MPLTYPLNAGELNKRITIEEDVGTEVTDSGEHVESWAELGASGSAWAAIVPLSGRELWNALQVQPDVTHKVTIRYRSGVNPKMRISFGSRYFNIISVIDREEMRTAMDLLCMERV